MLLYILQGVAEEQEERTTSRRGVQAHVRNDLLLEVFRPKNVALGYARRIPQLQDLKGTGKALLREFDKRNVHRSQS